MPETQNDMETFHHTGGQLEASPLIPDWVKPGAIFTYRGQVEKLLDIQVMVTTVGHNAFYNWHAPSFHLSVRQNEILHAPFAGLHTRLPASHAQPPSAKIDPAAHELFRAAYASFCADAKPVSRMLRWTRAISTGDAAEPWEHILGLLLIEIGAEYRGLGRNTASPQGAGRPPARQAKAAATQKLIAAFQVSLGGGNLIADIDWKWLRSLFETGLVCVGLMPKQPARGAGRPPVMVSRARGLIEAKLYGLIPAKRGGLTQAIREAALDGIHRRRSVQAAWDNRPWETVKVADDDPEIVVETDRIYSSYRSIMRRKGAT